MEKSRLYNLLTIQDMIFVIETRVMKKEYLIQYKSTFTYFGILLQYDKGVQSTLNVPV